MGKLNEIKEKIQQQLRSVEYEIWEYKDQLKIEISDVKRDEIKKELSYLTGRAISLRETLDMIEKVILE